MGLLDKIKSAKNFVTGGGAKVSLEVGGAASLGGTVPVRVHAQVAGADLSVNQVYVRVRAVEIVQMTVRDRDDPGDRDRVNEQHETLDQTFAITGPVQLPANSQQTWEGQIQIPSGGQPTYLGRNARHVWSFQAGLDVRGNDPDSGWTEIQVR